MFNWLKKREIKPSVSVENRLKKLEIEFLELTLEQELLRDKILRKIQFKKRMIEENNPDDDRKFATDALPKSKELNTLHPFG